jgi:predicted nuclease with TOPRIM domain
MNKTKVDDFLIEMITPKIQKIEEKFSKGEGLNLEDVNTLLLKSQYNHINHLDSKLNEVSDSVVRLESKFNDKFNNLEGKFNDKFSGLENKFVELEVKFEQAQVKMQDTIISTMRWYIGGAGVVLVLLKSLDLFIKVP